MSKGGGDDTCGVQKQEEYWPAAACAKLSVLQFRQKRKQAVSNSQNKYSTANLIQYLHFFFF